MVKVRTRTTVYYGVLRNLFRRKLKSWVVITRKDAKKKRKGAKGSSPLRLCVSFLASLRETNCSLIELLRNKFRSTPQSVSSL